MVPDKFNMVDMDGIDLIMMQGEEVPGLYMRLVESIAQCRYQCLYNWFFNGVVIPPTYVRLEVNEDDEVVINEGVTVSPDDVLHIYSLEIEPILETLNITENGTYTPEGSVDGFSSVSVDVSPVLEALNITENGTYLPETGFDGFSTVNANVEISWQEMEFERGGFNTFGLNEASTVRLRSVNYYNCAPNEEIIIRTIGTLETATFNLSVSFYTANDYTTPRVDFIAWSPNNMIEVSVPDGVSYFRVIISYRDNSTITVSNLRSMSYTK